MPIRNSSTRIPNAIAGIIDSLGIKRQIARQATMKAKPAEADSFLGGACPGDCGCRGHLAIVERRRLRARRAKRRPRGDRRRSDSAGHLVALRSPLGRLAQRHPGRSRSARRTSLSCRRVYLGQHRSVRADSSDPHAPASCSRKRRSSPALRAVSAARKLPRDFAIGLVLGLAVFLFFVKFLNVNLPAGWLKPLLGGAGI